MLSSGNIYKGQSNDLRLRIKDHQSGKVKSTKSSRPVKLIGYEAYLLKSDAIRREKYLKSTEGIRMLKQQYRDIIKRGGPSRHPTGRHVE